VKEISKRSSENLKYECVCVNGVYGNKGGLSTSGFEDTNISFCAAGLVDTRRLNWMFLTDFKLRVFMSVILCHEMVT